ncbi:MAG: PqqD family protein [Dehalococcoidia bacterium]
MTIPVSATGTVALKSDVVARSAGDEMILLDLESGEYFTLNAVGAVIWKGLESGLDLSQILTAVIEQFEVEEPVAKSDIDEYIDSLISEGLVLRK